VINRFVALCLRRRWLIVAIFVLLALFGWYSWTTLDIEAYPDIADVTSQVITQYPGHAAEEVEQQITIPLERELIGTPGLAVMRSKSTFGLSLIVMVFEDGVEDYFSRTRIRERIGDVTLPSGVTPTLDPLTSPIGEIYRYTLQSPTRSSRELRELQEWVVIPQFKEVFGVADVANFGGERTQFQILLDPSKLRSYNLSLAQVEAAVTSNNANAGGSVLVRGDQAAVVRGIGLVRSLDDLGHIVVDSRRGTPIFIRDLGRLQLGALTRDGICGKDGNGDVVSGIVLLLRGQNPSAVLDGIHARVRLLNGGLLPPDVKVVPYIDRNDLVHATVHTVSRTLLEGMGLVLIVLILFLGRPRGALIVAATIPLSLLIAFILMALTKIPANLLSLGAIDFGILVDGSIVVLENILRVREKEPEKELTEAVAADGATQVARPMFFATTIIITAYLPLFAFQRVEKKLFSPMAYTVGYALVGAILVALALIPGLALTAFGKPAKPYQNRALRWLSVEYHEVLRRILHRPWRAVAFAAGATALAILIGLFVGREFLPYLDEGSLWLQIELPPGISLQKAAEMANEIRRETLKEPVVNAVVTQTGRNDDGTDPWTPSHIEAAVTLKPYGTWPRGMRKKDLIEKLRIRYEKIPGINVGFSQPMIDGVNDKIAGAHSELVVKVYGKDFAGTRKVALELADLLGKIPGAVDVAIDQEPPLPQLQIEVDRDSVARYGLNVSTVGDLIETGVGGKPVGQVFQGERYYDITARYIEPVRNSPEAIGNLMLTTPTGAQVPLSSVASIQLRTGESTITREMSRRHMTVKLDLHGRDLSSFLKEAHERIDRDLKFDRAAYEIAWGGQFENQKRAQARLAVILPLTLALIFLLLYGAFGTLRHAAIILISVPMALLGGMLALFLRGMTLNVSSSVGFIALFGVAVQNGVIMVTQLNRRRDQGLPLHEAIVHGALQRLRPVLMTASVAILGLLPASLALGIGSDVQRPLATVVVGGLTTSTILTLLVLPAFYLLAEERFRRKRAGADIEEEAGR